MNPSLFAGMKEAKPRFDSNYIREGQYVVRINECKIGKRRTDDEFAAIVMTIVHVFEDSGGKGHKLGEECTHMILRIKGKEMFLSTIKSFIANMTSSVPDDVTEEIAMAIFGPENLFAGKFAHVIARQIMTKKNTPFTVVNYKSEIGLDQLKEILTEDEQKRFIKTG